MESLIKNIFVTFINFNSEKKDNPSIKNQGFCFLSSGDFETLRKIKAKHKQNSSSAVYNYYKWYNLILQYENSVCAKDCRLRINQYEIQSGCFDAFCINGDFYPTVTIILSTEMKHWYYSVPGSESIHLCGSKVLDKTQEIIENLDILKKKQRALRPEPNNHLLGVIKQAYTHEPSIIAISKPPYFECRYEPSLDCLDNVCKCDNLTKFDEMFQSIKNKIGGDKRDLTWNEKVNAKCLPDEQKKSAIIPNELLKKFKI